MNKRRKLSKMNVKKQHLAYGAITLVALFSCILAVTVIFKSSQVTTESLSKADKVRVAKKSKMNKATSKSKVEGVKQAPKPSSQSTEANSQQQVTASEEAAVEQAVVTENTPATSQAQQAYAVTDTTYRPAQHQPSGQVLSNGNTAGAIGSAAAAQMAAATGVPQSTWEHIIARESNGNPNVANASGASGLFQTMPGWGSTATVQDQVNSAIKAYRAQGLSAWGY
ncbi:TPA: transglycosylase SLT domain-containing protein [Streptococcus agalactiae]|uniref:transglycosylase SLT domain-containing protein n=1 Tax=Streptococcus agalactiae TaxID=1311 RepID=UPI000E72E7F7|nr:transglycosylase SLT domain-containing protein [Streptococcus agalactiae]RJX44671.1 lytic transglycosylase domain-containing protein [Streptococcus agalactiae]HEM9978115.1 transglycosylase SLT domain-containing protein [Streptococcus agalactiae]HEM9984474.1 transglycosylase SLT domain-containing protein [Streptococcus agalactiae]HEN0082344.1 transglycosylase SLT domain-containing protein [Streptococcus agalactiae]HEN0142549.1 transglycosylase SLT domain-containing protein [Streptococcus aga